MAPGVPAKPCNPRGPCEAQVTRRSVDLHLLANRNAPVDLLTHAAMVVVAFGRTLPTATEGNTSAVAHTPTATPAQNLAFIPAPLLVSKGDLTRRRDNLVPMTLSDSPAGSVWLHPRCGRGL